MGLKLFWGAWLCQPWFRPCLLPCLHSPLPINTHTRAQTAEWQTTNTRSLGLLEPPVFLRKMAKNHSSLPRPAPNAPSPSMRQKASIKLSEVFRNISAGRGWKRGRGSKRLFISVASDRLSPTNRASSGLYHQPGYRSLLCLMS